MKRGLWLVCGMSVMATSALVYAKGFDRHGRWSRNRDGFMRDRSVRGWDRTFGIPGVPGADGASGYPGALGHSPAPLFMNSASRRVALNLAGGDGGPAGNGSYAEPARQCRQFAFGRERVRENLIGAPGADGGDAGQGGAGGDGGNLVVYYTDEEDLRKVMVDASGGRPGPNGTQPGAGAPGCQCSVPVWDVRVEQPDVCEDVVVSGPPQGDRPTGGRGNGGPGRPKDRPNDRKDERKDGKKDDQPEGTPPETHIERRCRHVPDVIERHYCFDGYDGESGDLPSEAPYGRTGSVTFIKQAQPLTATSPSRSFSLDAPIQGALLSNDLWVQRFGAIARLAPGSVVNDVYSEWNGRVQSEANVVWKASRSNGDLRDVPMTLTIGDDGALNARYRTDQIWLQYSLQQSPAPANSTGSATLEITSAVRPSEAQAFSAVISGNKENTTLTLTDANALSDLLDTEVTVRIESKGVFWHTNFKINDPKSDYQQLKMGSQIQKLSARQFVIPIGKIYPSKNKGDLNGNKVIKVTLQIARRLSGGNGGQNNVMQIVSETKLAK